MLKSLEELSAELISECEYFTNLLSLMDKKYTNDPNFTAGVKINKKGKVELIVSKPFFKSLNENQRKKILIHECLHVLHSHLATSINSKVNIAMDVAINQLCNISSFFDVNKIACIENASLWEENFTPKKNQTWKYYFDNLKEDLSNQLQSLDDHEEFGKGDQQVIEKAINEAYGKTSAKGKSQIEEIFEIIGLGQVNWRKELRKVVANNMPMTEKRTLLKSHKRIPTSKGSKTLIGTHVAFIVDSSGSMDSDMINEVLKEAKFLHKTINAKITLIVADSQVNDVIEYTGQKGVNIIGRGGTVYQPAIDYAHEIKADVTVLAGDGGCFDSPMPRNKKPFVWLINKGYNCPVDWGKVIQL